MSDRLETEALVLHGAEQQIARGADRRDATTTVNEDSLAKQWLKLLQDVMDRPFSLCMQRLLYSTLLGTIPLNSSEFLARLKRIQLDSSAASGMPNWQPFLGGPVPWRALFQAIVSSSAIQSLARFIADDCARSLTAHPDVVSDILDGENVNATAPDDTNFRRPRPHVILFRQALLRLPFVFDRIARGFNPGVAAQFDGPKWVILGVALVTSWHWFRGFLEERIKERNMMTGNILAN